MSQEIKQLRISNDAMDDPQELQRRIADEGYLFFRRLVDPDKMLELRREMMSMIQQVGWLIAGHRPHGRHRRYQHALHRGRQRIHGRLRRSLQERELPPLGALARVPGHRGQDGRRARHAASAKVARIWFPKYTEHTTPTHQDFVHFQGSYDNITCWAPIGDCPIELGGLAVIPESHKVERVLEHHFSLGAGGLIVDETEHEDIDPVWHSIDYQAGDALFFPALTIHRALPNFTDDRLRLSLDNRYMIVGDQIAEHMLEPHGPSNLSWEDIYPHWRMTTSNIIGRTSIIRSSNAT